jgi:hypothetical protein
VTWDAPDDGGSTILSYHFVWDAGTGNTDQDLVGLVVAYTDTQHTVAVQGVAGTPYSFQVRAKNVYGWGEHSDIVQILASDVPAQMQVVSTAVDGTDVEISWTEPADNGEAITGYQIEILHSDGVTFSQETGTCDGVNVASIVSLRRCDIPIATLAEGAFSLTYGTLIQAKILAINAQGSGTFSQLNTVGATMQTAPL